MRIQTLGDFWMMCCRIFFSRARKKGIFMTASHTPMTQVCAMVERSSTPWSAIWGPPMPKNSRD